MAIVEMTITTSLQTVNIGGGVMANVETYNGTVPGTQIDLEVGDTLIVRLVNNLPHPTGIHWHGLELHNSADGTPVTQDGLPGAVIQTLGNGVPAGGTYLYKFDVPRAGIFWYHAHHFHSTNRTFRGLYGMIVVKDPVAESLLITNGTIPDVADTFPLVLSDTTVCKAPGFNDAATYVDPTTLPPADAAEWLSGSTSQGGPTPTTLCELPTAVDENGVAGATAFAAGDIPNTQTPTGQVNEGQTVLTNGINVGGRLGTPAAPGALVPPNMTQTVAPGQGARFLILNCSTSRYFRLRLTDNSGTQIPLIRIGGEAGLLDNAIAQGGSSVGPGLMDWKYDNGEILLPPATRADVVVAIPAAAVGTLTMWTRDFEHKGGSWTDIPTVPVLHLDVVGPAVGPFTIADGDPILASIAVPPVVSLGAATSTFLDPTAFVPAKPGLASQDVKLTGGGSPSIDSISGSFSGFMPYTNAPHIASTRWAEEGETLELTVTNMTGTHHPFHLHGFSFQPISIAPRVGAPGGTPTGTYTWPYPEYVDTLDVPGHYTLTYRVLIEDRPLADGMTMGGAFGRWLFHCHIFYHAHRGMLSELVISKSDGTEKPDVDVNGSWAYAPTGGIATRTGTFSHPDSKPVTLTAHLAGGSPIGTLTQAAGTWSWNSGPGILPDQETYVYVTGVDPDGCADQAVFRMKIGGADDGSDNGDPHIRCLDGTKYDFQAVGEFTVLRDYDGLEVQTRQTPVLTANPITGSYTGIKACVSLNTAAAARVGSHRVSYQPGRKKGTMIFYLDGKQTDLTKAGFDLDGCTVRGFDANNGGNALGLRINYEHNAVVTITPRFWNSHQLWYLNISISRTQADEGLMGPIAPGSWLPKLSSGATLGPKPANVADRYTHVYKYFADSWRLTDATSLFVYGPGESTATFTDKNWPAIKPPCKLLPQFEIPGAPLPQGMPVKEAQIICKGVTEGDLNADCVFDVATTGDKTFADGYLFEQQLRLRGTAVQVVSNVNPSEPGQSILLLAIVSPIKKTQKAPTGTVVFYANDTRISDSVKLNDEGHAQFKLGNLDVGQHKIRAEYSGSKMYDPSSSPNLIQVVKKP